jgi:trans-2,3-dihydro-3-hydroxyanthranilate isomerase
MGRRYRFRTVDVFTDRALSGNALAVFLDADDLSDDEMQALATEMHLSETSFVLTPTDEGRAAGADYRARFFTPGVELPFAGHPSLGTAWVLADERRLSLRPEGTTVRQELAVGVLPLHLPGAGDGPPSEVTMVQSPPEVLHRLDDDEIDELCEALEVARGTLGWPTEDEPGGQEALPCVASTGLAHLVVALRERALLDDIDRTRTDELAEIVRSLGASSAALVAPGGSGAIPDADGSVRIFDPADLRIDVDAATGAAAGPIAMLLGEAAGIRDATFRLALEQGTEIRRPSRLVAEIDFGPDGRAREARVSGGVVPIAEGWVTLP